FQNWDSDWRRCELELPDLRLALEWALRNDGGARSLADRAIRLSYRIGRLPEAFELCERMRQVAEDRKDSGLRQAWLGNQAVILQAWGRLEEAMELHKKQEAICLEWGNPDGLLRSYGNQALILQVWGRLEEAMELHKKQETICLELG